MARYRKVDPRMWGDAKFNRLSAPAPNGQTLWTWLLTGPRTCNIPGVVLGRPSALAADIGWPPKAFAQALSELHREGMVKGSDATGFLWLPNGPKYNPPESPNVVVSWRDTWDLVPETGLKDHVYQELKAFAEGLGQAFGEAFGKAFPKGCHGAPTCCWEDPSPNQEQEQEQEQEQDQQPFVRSRAPRQFYHDDFLTFWNAYPRKTAKGAAAKAWGKAKPNLQSVLLALRWQAGTEQWTKDGGQYIPLPTTYLNQRRWEDEPQAPAAPPESAAMKALRISMERAHARDGFTGQDVTPTVKGLLK